MKSLLAIVLGTTLLTTSDQTIWWHTDGAAVIEFHETNECAMFLYDNMRAVIISWGKNNETIGIEDDSLQLTQGVAVPIAVQIGTTWIGDPNIPDLTAYGSGHDLAVPLDPSLLSIAKDKWMPFFDHLIVGADHITFKMPDTEITYETPRPKLPALVAAVDKCRKMISR